jgi:hypothetical protein
VADYTIVRAAEAPDYTGDAPGAFLGYGRPLGAEQLAFNVRVLAPHTAHVPPGGDPTWGHSHRTIEEIYFVLAGEITIKLGDDVTTPPSPRRRAPPACNGSGGPQRVGRGGRIRDVLREGGGHPRRVAAARALLAGRVAL